MTTETKVRFMCLICGRSSQAGAGFCSVNLHQYAKLKPNEKRTGYKGWFQQGGAHHSCIRGLLLASDKDPDRCAVCLKRITLSSQRRATKVAIYIYRKRGCAGIVSIHDACFKRIKSEAFPFLKP